jgi:hypothetical protein
MTPYSSLEVSLMRWFSDTGAMLRSTQSDNVVDDQTNLTTVTPDAFVRESARIDWNFALNRTSLGLPRGGRMFSPTVAAAGP